MFTFAVTWISGLGQPSKPEVNQVCNFIVSTNAPNFTKEYENFGRPEILTFLCAKKKEEDVRERERERGREVENEMLLSSSWFFPFSRSPKTHSHTIHISPHAFLFYIFDMRTYTKSKAREVTTCFQFVNSYCIKINTQRASE